MIAPRGEIDKWFHPKDRQVLEIAQINRDFLFEPNSDKDLPLLQMLGPTSIVLMINKESMLIDPIDWSTLKNNLRVWADSIHIDLSIPDWTDKLFLERAFPQHKPRVAPITQNDTNCCVYRFFDPLAPMRNEEKHMIECGVPADLARLLDRANRHDRKLSMLGILPNQLRTILQASTDKPEEGWYDISKTLFWSGYEIWKKRRRLVKAYWNNIAPNEWKKNKKEKDKTLSRKKKKRSNPSQCVDPFHFFPKSNDFTKQRPTKCKCSEYHRPAKRLLSQDIRSFSNRFPTISQEQKIPDFHSTSKIMHKEQMNPHRSRTKTDRIRDQHDS